jgi:hypothetical protein
MPHFTPTHPRAQDESLLLLSSRRVASRRKRLALSNDLATAPKNDSQQRCISLLSGVGRKDLASDYLSAVRERLAEAISGTGDQARSDDDLAAGFKKLLDEGKSMSAARLVERLATWTVQYEQEVNRRAAKDSGAII